MNKPQIGVWSVRTAPHAPNRIIEWTTFRKVESPTKWVVVIGGSYMGLDSFCQDHTFAAMPNYVGVLFVNRPGYGRTSPSWFIDDVYADIQFVLEIEQIKAVHCVLAMSAGARYAVGLANRIKANRIVLTSPVAPITADVLSEMEEGRRNLMAMAQQRPKLARTINWLTTQFLHWFPEQGYQLLADSFSEWDQQLLGRKNLKERLVADLCVTAGGLGFSIELAQLLSWREIGSFAGPITLFWGSDDTVCTPAMLMPWLSLKDQRGQMNCAVESVSNVGHFMWLDNSLANRIWHAAVV